MELEIYQKFILTAVFSILIAFLISKIAAVGAGHGGLKQDASVPHDLGVFASSVMKVENIASKEAVSCAGTEEVLASLDRVVDEMIRTEEDFYGQMSDIVVEKDEERIRLESDEVIYVVETSTYSDDVIREEGCEEVGLLPSVDAMEIDCESRRDIDDLEDERSLLHGEDDWEGIEKSDLEIRFDEAVEYIRSSNGAAALAKLSSDVQMEIFGLNKIATEGPCYESQPLSLNFSARAKWQAWQRLGNMAPEAAMEHYISVLSKYMPEWMSTIKVK